MMQAPGGQTWYRLTPDSTGNYTKGTVSTMPLMHDTRDAFPSVMLPDGRVVVAGGEYGTGGNTAEMYDPQANTWVAVPKGPLGDLADTPAKLLPDRRALVGRDEPGYTQIYNPATNS